MERLTRRLTDGRSCFKPHLYGHTNKEACDRLAAYEDTGLEPDAISKIRDIVLDISGDLDRLRELAQADKEGRCVVLPPDDYTWAIRGDIVRGIIKANCRAAKKDAEAALRREQE